MRKVLDVASGNGGVSGDGDPGNLRVSHVCRATGALAMRCQGRCGDRRSRIEVEDAILEVVVQQQYKQQFERATPLPRRQGGQTEPNLKHSDARDPYRLGRLPVEPLHNAPVGGRLHDGRQNVCVEDDHRRLLVERGCARELPAQFRQFHGEAGVPESISNAAAQLSNRTVFAGRRLTKDVAHLVFHAAAVSLRSALKTRIDISLDISNDELRH